ncbi:MAG: HupE/UreJ family protein [Gammaproteobacteria bacterium]|nr:MAG: HupE/UreJ family protein [Gammaproteobacteria bacterium]
MRWAATPLVLIAIMGLVDPSLAHTIRPTVATIVVDSSGEIDIRIRANVEAMLAAIGAEHSDTNDSPNAGYYIELRAMEPRLLAQQFSAFAPTLLNLPILQADGAALAFSYEGLEVPPVGDQELARDSIILLKANVVSGAGEIVWVWPEHYGSSVVRFSYRNAEEGQSQWLQTGETSDPFKLAVESVPQSRLAIALNYLAIGFEHIVPKGLDHILFVTGIFLLSIYLKPLLLQVTAFTVAHTITLGLGIYGLISAPASIVEPLIALSIAYVGIENCLSAQLKPWRIALVFLFGLLHGMGFAGVLGEIGLPRSEFLTALISFNIGVELGQLAVIAACFLLFGLCRSRYWYRRVIVIPISLLISLTGLYWTWERTLG